MQSFGFTHDHMDVLQEYLNIAMGSATASIAELLDAFGTMHVPEVEILSSDALKQRIEESVGPDDVNFVTKQLFTGEFAGENLFIIEDASAQNLGNHLYGVDVPNEHDILDAVAELTNILSSTIISTFSRELETEVQFLAPSTQVVVGPNIIQDNLQSYSKVIIISTLLEFRDQNVEGNIYILTKDEPIRNLKALIDRKLELLFG